MLPGARWLGPAAIVGGIVLATALGFTGPARAVGAGPARAVGAGAAR